MATEIVPPTTLADVLDLQRRVAKLERRVAPSNGGGGELRAYRFHDPNGGVDGLTFDVTQIGNGCAGSIAVNIDTGNDFGFGPGCQSGLRGGTYYVPLYAIGSDDAGHT